MNIPQILKYWEFTGKEKSFMRVKPADRATEVREYYFSAKLRQIEQMRSSGADIINLGIGSPDLPPSEETIRTLSEEAARPDAHGYQGYAGLTALRKAFAEWYRKYFKVQLNPDGEILPLIGSKEGIMHISMAFVNPGDEVLVPDPGYPTYSSATILAGGIVKTYDLKESNGWLPDFNQLEKLITGRVKLMWVNYPHMPTGTPSSDILFERLVRFAEKHKILVCNDNPYSFILNEEHHSILSVPGAMESALELNSLSKSHNMAGWRIGMAAGNKEYINAVLRVKSNMDSGMFMPLQMAAVKALSNDKTWYSRLNSIYEKRRRAAEQIMDILKCSFNPSQSGMFLWGRVPDAIESTENFVEEILQNAHVFITPGFIFGKNGNRYLRISLCSTEEKLLNAREKIVNYLKRNNRY
jgi:aspartate/methionine/tyrosine aminotransferase